MSSPYMTTRESAEFLRYRSIKGFLKMVKRQQLPHINREREKLFLKADLINHWSARVGAKAS